MGLDHGMVGGALDDMLQLGDHMAGRDQESPRVAAHRLVCRAMKGDQPVTAELPALTAKRDDSIPASAGDGLVELAKSDLVERDAPRADVIHVLSVSEVSTRFCPPIVPAGRNGAEADVGFQRCGNQTAAL